jgi:hypothetical protein
MFYKEQSFLNCLKSNVYFSWSKFYKIYFLYLFLLNFSKIQLFFLAYLVSINLLTVPFFVSCINSSSFSLLWYFLLSFWQISMGSRDLTLALIFRMAQLRAFHVDWSDWRFFDEALVEIFLIIMNTVIDSERMNTIKIHKSVLIIFEGELSILSYLFFDLAFSSLISSFSQWILTVVIILWDDGFIRFYFTNSTFSFFRHYILVPKALIIQK